MVQGSEKNSRGAAATLPPIFAPMKGEVHNAAAAYLRRPIFTQTLFYTERQAGKL